MISKPSQSSPDVIILGAGIIGCSIARELAKQGALVRIYERHSEVAAEVTGASIGVLSYSPSLNRPKAWHKLASSSIQQHRALMQEFSRETDTGPMWHWIGRLNVSLNEKSTKKLEKRFQVEKENNFASEWMDPKALKEHGHALTHKIQGGIFYSDHGWVDPKNLTIAIEQSAAKHGARFFYQQCVEKILVERHTAVGIRVGKEKITAGHVVIAAGAWSAGLDPELECGVAPIKGQAIHIHEHKEQLQHIVFGNGVYLVPCRGGLTVGATHEHVGFNNDVTLKATTHLLNRAKELCPQLASVEAKDVSAWSGLRPGTQNRVPWIGPSGKIKHLWWATGHYTHGILLAPITAKIISDGIVFRKETDLYTTLS
ncbi:FAD-dependent oxidoreductase [PVC group bacterium]|nr:FAD-dependent oxidoreductase [PVC group bacterium]